MISLLTLVNVLAYVAQTTVVIAVGLAVLRLLRVDAPGARYVWLRTMLVLCLVLPFVQPRVVLTPTFATDAEVDVLATGSGDGAAGSAPRARLADRAGAIPLSADAIALLLLGGILARLLWIGAGVVRLRSLRRTGETAPQVIEFEDLQRVIGTRAAIRYVPRLGQPVTFGWRRPVVLLPERMRELPEAIQRAVAAHELWHVKRRDWTWTVAEEGVRAALWFHPMIWHLISRIQASREEVVDELSVLTTGSRKSYLDALVRFADEPSLFAATAFARRRHLVRRMLLISKESVMSSTRLVASFLVAGAVVIVAGWYTVLALPLTQAQQPPRDPVRTPSEVAARTEAQRKLIEVQKRIEIQPTAENHTILATFYWEMASRDATLTADQKAEYVEKGIAATDNALARNAEYVPALIYKNILLRTKASAVADPLERDRLMADADILRNRAIELRKAQTPEQRRGQEVSIFSPAPGQAPPPPPPPPPPPGYVGGVEVDGVTPIRVGGTIAPPTKIKDVRPEYPDEARAGRVQGVVIMETVIDTAGRVRDARVLRSVPLLDKAALDAVRQWEFTPVLMNGVPTPVIMTVTVSFSLQ